MKFNLGNIRLYGLKSTETQLIYHSQSVVYAFHGFLSKYDLDSIFIRQCFYFVFE